MRSERERLSGGDEISLLELLQGGWQQKTWMFAAAIPVLLAGLAYVLLAKPVYEAKLYVQPPSQTDVAQLNYGRGGNTGLGTWAVKDVYEIYLTALQSQTLRDSFFRKIYLPSLSSEERDGSWDMLYRKYTEVLNVAATTKNVPSPYVITVDVEDPRMAADWVVRYAEMAADLAKQEIMKANRSEMQVKADNIEQQIAGDRASAKREREDKVATLKEALAVAKAIGLKRPPLISRVESTEFSAVIDGSLSYMRGSDALENEIANLESRISDDPFIPNLRRNQQALELYRNIKLEEGVISVYRQDGAVEQPATPVKPKKLLLLILTCFFAVILGVFVGIARGLWLRMGGQP